jgi:hypothetical protein
VTCTVSFYQFSPAADGVAAILRGAGHHTRYTVVLRTLPHHPTGYTVLPWKA